MELAADELLRALECPICFDDLAHKEIYQCPNGHIQCLNCYSRKSKLCHTCRIVMPKRPIRNRALEFLVTNADLRQYAEAPTGGGGPGQRKRTRRPLTTHPDVACDSPACKKAKREAIQGVRFKCVQCPDYDLCETCVMRTHKHHLFLRIAKPEQEHLAERFADLIENHPPLVEVAVEAERTFMEKVRDGFVSAFRFIKRC